MNGHRARSLRRLLVVTGDHRAPDPTKWDGRYVENDLALHDAMCDALASLGGWEIEVCSDHTALMTRLTSDPPDLVFNLCDTGFQNVATHELHVPALLEILGVPYTGAPPAAMVLAYDKPLVNLLAAALGLSVPREVVVEAVTPLDCLDVTFPALVKPARADGSVGINRGAVVRSDGELRRQIGWFRELLPGQAAVVQEYLSGPEYGLALIGNVGHFRALPMLEVDYSKLPPEVPPILAFESKTGPDNPYSNINIVPAHLDAGTVERLVEWATRLFERIGCRDYARFDFRTAQDGTITLMEVNPNPAWSREAKLALMARFGGIDYPQLLEMLIDTAWTRVTKQARLDEVKP